MLVYFELDTCIDLCDTALAGKTQWVEAEMIVPHKKVSMITVGRVTSNQDGLVIITMPSEFVGAQETMRVRRWKSETEEHFKAEWPVGREVKVEVRR